MKIIVFCCLLCMGHTLLSQELSPRTGSLATMEEAKSLLAFHNRVRADVGSPPLEWSEKLAAFAQAWAEELASGGCKIRHRPRSGEWKQLYGENIWWGSSAEFYTVNSAAESWYDEISDYRHGPLRSENFGAAGHYTQMVWKNSKKMGMGVARCKNGGIIVVANYDPPGNWMGEMAY